MSSTLPLTERPADGLFGWTSLLKVVIRRARTPALKVLRFRDIIKVHLLLVCVFLTETVKSTRELSLF